MAAASAEPNRRTFLAQTASASLLATMASPVWAETPDDPIYAAIEVHRAAALSVKAMVDIPCEEAHIQHSSPRLEHETRPAVAQPAHVTH